MVNRCSLTVCNFHHFLVLFHCDIQGLTLYDLYKYKLKYPVSKYTVLQNHYIGLICIDEAQYIKNTKSQTTQALKKLKAPLRVALSGTPVENNLAELWSVFDFVLPKYLGNLKDFKSSYSKPIEVSIFLR